MHFEHKRNAVDASEMESNNKTQTLRLNITEQMQGLRSARKRSLLSANEHFEHERNAVDAREIESNNKQELGYNKQ